MRRKVPPTIFVVGNSKRFPQAVELPFATIAGAREFRDNERPGAPIERVRVTAAVQRRYMLPLGLIWE